MRRIDTLRLGLIGYFCVPPLNEQEEKLGFHRKNRYYLNNLVKEARGDFQVRIEVFEELKRLNGNFFEDAPIGSFANIFLCRTAVEIATPWETPILIKMLFWPSVLSHQDNSYISILLEGIREKGYVEDAEALLVFHQELGKPQRYYYSEGDGTSVASPGMIRLRAQVAEIIGICRNRGPRESEAARIAGGAPSAQGSDFLWTGAGQ